MANSFILPTSGAAAVPSPDAVVSGQTIESETIKKFTRIVNFTHAHLGCSPVVSQGYQGAVFSVTGTPTDYNCIWRVPVPSNAHQTVVILVKAKLNNVGTGSIVFTETENSNTATINITSNTAPGYRAALSTGSQSNEYAEITAKAIHSGSTGTIIEYVSLHWLPLTSPLAAGQVTQNHFGTLKITPLGEDRSGADNPLASARGKALVQTLRALAKRPRPLFAWSGLQRVTPPQAPKTMLPDMFREFRALIRAWGGSRDRDHEYAAYVFAATHGNGDDRVILWRRERQTIAAATVTPSWVELTDLEPSRRESISDQADTEMIRDGLDRPPTENVAPASPVWSVQIWGP